MRKKRVTIYDIAKEMGLSPSYISKALNNHPSMSEKAIEKVRKAAAQLNYKPNSLAANFRNGKSKTIGVIVPSINQRFFSDAISGIEEVCFEHNHSLIICQSNETYLRECKAIDTLIRQDVDCILISISAETSSAEYLNLILSHDIELVQFDRYLDLVKSMKVLNDNFNMAYEVTKNMIASGYTKIAFLGGPRHIAAFNQRKEGFLKALNDSELMVPYNFIWEDLLSTDKAVEVAEKLLQMKNRPDAIVTVSDHQALKVLQLAKSYGIQIPEELGIFGFANEDFSSLVSPGISSVDQKSKELGKRAAYAYFDSIDEQVALSSKPEEIVSWEIQPRESSARKVSVLG